MTQFLCGRGFWGPSWVWGLSSFGTSGRATLPWVAEWEKACRNMELRTFRNTADQSVRSVEKGVWGMNLWVRQLRGLCLVGMVLAGIAFCAAVAAVGTAGYAAAQSSGSVVVEGDRRVEAET